MTQKEKDLLLNDLCSRLPHGVIIEHKGNLSKLDAIFMCDSISISSTSMDKKLSYNLDLDEVKPYLYPLSSMTEEQYKEYNTLRDSVPTYFYEFGDIVEDEVLYDNFKSIDYLIVNHFDYRDLIPMGLAKDATGLNIY